MAIPARVLRRPMSTSALAVAIFVAALPSVLMAQTIRSTVTGTVTDPNRAVVAPAGNQFMEGGNASESGNYNAVAGHTTRCRVRC